MLNQNNKNNRCLWTLIIIYFYNFTFFIQQHIQTQDNFCLIQNFKSQKMHFNLTFWLFYQVTHEI